MTIEGLGSKKSNKAPEEVLPKNETQELYKWRTSQYSFRNTLGLYEKVAANILKPEFYYTRWSGYLMAFTTPSILIYYMNFTRGRYLMPVFLCASTFGTFANFHYQLIREVNYLVQTDTVLGNSLRETVLDVHLQRGASPNYSEISLQVLGDRAQKEAQQKP